jgi:hypothetical protein
VPTLAGIITSTSVIEGTAEFMVHPGLVDGELRHLCPNFAEPRAQELSVLTDPHLHDALKRLPLTSGTTPACRLASKICVSRRNLRITNCGYLTLAPRCKIGYIRLMSKIHKPFIPGCPTRIQTQ